MLSIDSKVSSCILVLLLSQTIAPCPILLPQRLGHTRTECSQICLQRYRGLLIVNRKKYFMLYYLSIIYNIALHPASGLDNVVL